jgi:glutathione S-transferase
VLQARAQILRFLGIASTAIYPAYSDWWNATHSDDPAKRNPAGADSALARVTRALGVLEKTLGSGAHLVGALSLADIANASIIFSLKRRLQVDPLGGLERTRAWYERVTARPGWRAVTAD